MCHEPEIRKKAPPPPPLSEGEGRLRGEEIRNALFENFYGGFGGEERGVKLGFGLCSYDMNYIRDLDGSKTLFFLPIFFFFFFFP